jgi:hypothetical protein
MGKFQDNKDAMEFFRTNDYRAADGAWSEFYESEVLEPRTMDLAKAEIPRHLWDNFNTPDLEQSEFLRPGETLEDWDVTFRRPNAQGGRIGFEEAGPVKSKFYAPKAAETKKLKATKKLKEFVEKFKLDNDGQLPTQQQIMKAVGGKSETIQKYLTEGVDYATRATKQEAGKLAGLKSGEVRAVPEGQDPSYVKRAKKIKESEKFQSKQDKADLEDIKKGKKEINKYFKNNPNAINNTEFGKNIKTMMAMRMDKNGNFYSRVMSDDYYKKKASEGKIYDLFDIKPVAEGGKNLRYPVNVNITPGQFNSAFIQAQVSKAFSKGVKPESVKFLDNYLKEKNIRVKLPNVGYVGVDEAVAVTGPKGQRTFPKITKTLESMQAPEEILKFFKIPKGERGFIQRELLQDFAKVGGKGARVASKYGIIPEFIFAVTDYLNEKSKGKSTEEARGIAVNNLTFGAYDDPKNIAYMKGLKKTAESMGIDARAFEDVYNLNVAGQTFDKYLIKGQERIENLRELGYDKTANDLQKNLDRYIEEQNKNLNNLNQKVIDQISISKAGGAASPLQLSKARDALTEEDYYKPFKDITKVAKEKLTQEKRKAFPTQKFHVDTAAGGMGEGFYKAFDYLTQGAKNVLQGRIIPYGPERFRPKESEREKEARYLREMEPRELYLRNKARGYTYDQPITEADLENLRYEQPGVFYSKGGRAGYMGGGIANLKIKW